MAKPSSTTSTKKKTAKKPTKKSTTAPAKRAPRRSIVEKIGDTAQVVVEVGNVAGHFADAIAVPPSTKRKRNKDPLDHVRGAVVKTARAVETAGKMVESVTTAVEHAELKLELFGGQITSTHLGEAADILLKHVNGRKPRTLLITQKGKVVAALVGHKQFATHMIEAPQVKGK